MYPDLCTSDGKSSEKADAKEFPGVLSMNRRCNLMRRKIYDRLLQWKEKSGGKGKTAKSFGERLTEKNDFFAGKSRRRRRR